jgi:hypothetical protein
MRIATGRRRSNVRKEQMRTDMFTYVLEVVVRPCGGNKLEAAACEFCFGVPAKPEAIAIH